MKKRRLSTWWIHWRDLDWPSYDNMEHIKRKAEALAKADVTSVITFGTHFRWDYLPYFTMLHDYLAAVCEECHNNGMELFDHHSINLIHRYNTREEFRHVMLHSGPHLPFSPSYEAAENWEYKGKRLNDWRMIDVSTNKPLYYPQYAGEGFCYRNPEFVDAYIDYAKTLVADTGIDGLSADDSVHYMMYRSCGCPSCRAEFKKRTGLELPDYTDTGFWGNFDNPAWLEWIDMRHEASGDFHEKLRAALPEDFTLVSCGARSAQPRCNATGSDVRQFLRGCDYANVEMAGNIPPYNDPHTINQRIEENIISASHHTAAGREVNKPCFGTVYAHTEQTAQIAWAVNKMTGADCWLMTLKDRLGLPRSILDTLPEEEDIVGSSFRFEKEHPELFGGDNMSQAAVYFSYETRNHTKFGNIIKGYYSDYCAAVRECFLRGISVHTVFNFPKDASVYPVVLLPSALKMTKDEQNGLNNYLKNGGKVIACGPVDYNGCVHNFTMPNCCEDSTEPFIPRKITVTEFIPQILNEDVPDIKEDGRWLTPQEGLFYNANRISKGEITEEFIEKLKSFANELPVKILSSKGYLISIFEDEGDITAHFLAADFDTEVDKKLDEMRYHRSRVNYINHITPKGISPEITLSASKIPDIYVPFSNDTAKVSKQGDEIKVQLPENCAYAIMHFKDIV